MSEHERDNLDPRQRAAQDAVRSLGTPAADPAFRARLREQFVAGAIPGREPPAAAPPRPRRVPVFGFGTLAAAAVLALAIVGLNRLPGPELLAAAGPGDIVVDGRAVAADDPALAGLLRPGVRMQVGDGTTVDILYPGSMVWRLAPGTDVVLPERPGRWYGRNVTADLALGEVSVRTGPDLVGGGLDVRTPAGTAVITGTLIDVFHNGELSCFCLHDGTARVLVDGADLGAIPDLQRRVVFMDGREPMLDAAAPPHVEHMAGLDRDYPDPFGGN